MRETTFHVEWAKQSEIKRFRTGISLHSHTLHSRESLDFIYKLSHRCRLLQWAVKQSERHYREVHGSPIDLGRGWWTPPLAPAAAHRLEAAQIENLGLTPIVSLSDHDDIEAPMSLQALEVPISVEWTVPFRETFFHLGIHNLPPDQARTIMSCLAEFTANPVESRIAGLLAELARLPGSLIVFNHPLWDEKGIGEGLHHSLALEFAIRYAAYLHAFEINGLRPQSENAAVARFAAERAKPAISGGDRHTLEPNATLNLTNATTFAEFADEIRKDQVSHVWIASTYRQPYSARMFQSVVDVFRTYNDHALGLHHWAQRIFFPQEDGTVTSLAQCWGGNPPAPIGLFASAMRGFGHPHLRPVLDAAFYRTGNVTL